MEQAIIWARGQISDCLNLHKTCAIQVNGRPTRLLDVDPDGNDTDIKLQDFSSISPDTSIEYAALSYCWGGHQPECITTPETLNRNLHHIWDLPQTFRDAVKVTRGLGLKYLWIDSICIIQGDENDWRREAGRMFDVYRGSKVTLAAVFGEDSRSGLRTTTIKQQTRLVANLTLGKSTYPLYFRPHHYLWNPKTGQHTHELSHNTPLLIRAWAYQERILSPRVLFFTESEVIFQCACEVKCECGSAIDGWKTELIADDKKMETIQGLSHEEYFTEYLFKIQQTWRRLVAWDYSILDLTDRRDKLAALGAIAEQFQRVRPGSRYLAGLWSNYLLDDLMWTSNCHYDMEKPDRPFSLPTWSWASMRGRVVYHLPLHRARHQAEVVEATCIYAKDNRFGVLEKSTLILSGTMLSCALHGDGKLYEPNSPGGGAWECLSSHALWDSGESGYPQDQEVYLLLLVDYGLEGVPSSDACGLILNAEDHNADPKIFSRLGVFMEMTFHSADDKKKYYPLDRAFKERGTLEKIEIR
ncbi:heterokaryon incompatibility protein-domain-containing protein [Phyllosticta capitalensis]